MASNPPDIATDEVAYSTRTAGPSRRRVALIASGALALAVGAVATSMAASPAPSASGTTNGTVPAPFLAAGLKAPLGDPKKPELVSGD